MSRDKMGNLNDFCLIKRDLASKYDSAISLDHAALIAYCKGKYENICKNDKTDKTYYGYMELISLIR